MKRAARFQTGSVVFDKRRKTWNFLWWEAGKRRSKLIGTAKQYPTKGAASRAAQSLTVSPPILNVDPTVRKLVEQYRQEKMPQRFSTKYGYEAWLNNHILPRWGECQITDMQARPVELWLHSLMLAPKSRVAIRGVISILWD